MQEQKPNPELVSIAARGMTHPESLSEDEIKALCALTMSHQKNDPMPHKPGPRHDKEYGA
jgi:hypothetical protein